MPAEAYPLRVEGLVKRYPLDGGGSLEAVAGISFAVAAGECFGLLGPNGAGKSTTIQCATGFYPPTAGRVLIDGRDVRAEPKAARRELGVCSQEETLDSDFSAFDQLVRHATFFRIPAEEGRRRARELLERFSLADKAREDIEHLSGGMRRRLQVARALISRPKVLILDEPTTGLDPEVRRALWGVLADYRRTGAAILLSTHYMEEAQRICDRVAVMSRGKILDVDAPGRLIERHIGAAEVAEELRPGVVWRRPPNLEDVYLKLTGAPLGAGDALS
jgi:lipooligosaccharide transport system ATP-binding protein